MASPGTWRSLSTSRKLLLGSTVASCTGIFFLNSATAAHRKDNLQRAHEAQKANPSSSSIFSSLQRRQPTSQIPADLKAHFQHVALLDEYWTPEFVARNLMLTQRNVDAGRYHTLLTHTFAHGGLLHLGANMYGLWAFGTQFLYLYGAAPFVGLWVAAGVSGGLLSIWADSDRRRLSVEGDGRRRGTVNVHEKVHLGASGSVLGLVTAMGVLFPKSKFFIFPLPVPLPAWVLTPAFFFGSWYMAATGAMEGIGHWGHMGGMVVGAVAGVLLRRVPYRIR
jgi:membrane associated rhomboid family serine protease